MKAILKRLEEKGTTQNNKWNGVFDVTSDVSGNQIGLYTMNYQAGSKGADMHFHKKMMEIFNVLEGQIEVFVNGFWEILNAGDTVVIPTRTIHAFRPLQTIDCKLQILFTPNMKREEFFTDFHLYVNASDKERYEFWAKYDQYPPELIDEN